MYFRASIELKNQRTSDCFSTTASEFPLDVHINGALNPSASRQEIVEAILLYATLRRLCKSATSNGDRPGGFSKTRQLVKSPTYL